MSLIVFHHSHKVAEGAAPEVLAQVRRYLAQQACVGADLLVLDRDSARLVEVDFGLDDAVILKLLGLRDGAAESGQRRGRGRPRLGVQSREVSLLPRHWQWLAQQSGGASATIRRLIEAARRSPQMQLDDAQQVVDRFLQTLAGDLPRYEEVLRQFYRGNDAEMNAQMADWPAAIVEHTQVLVAQVRHWQQVVVATGAS